MTFHGYKTSNNAPVEKWRGVTHEFTNERRKTVEYEASRKEEGKRSKNATKVNSRTSKSAKAGEWQVVKLQNTKSTSSGTSCGKWDNE